MSSNVTFWSGNMSSIFANLACIGFMVFALYVLVELACKISREHEANKRK